jgi:hypothetical protein
VIRIEAHERRQIEGDGESGLALREEVMVARVGLFGGGEPGELPHGPQPAAIHTFVDAAGVRELSGRGRRGGGTGRIGGFEGQSAEGPIGPSGDGRGPTGKGGGHRFFILLRGTIGIR